MIDPAEAARAFDVAFARRAPTGLQVRPETDCDASFLRELFLASYALRDVLPEPVLTHQIGLRLATFRDGFPGAMRRIVEDAGGPIGRMIVDWTDPAGPHCVDIAVRPAQGGRGVGTALLNAWIEVAEAHGAPCTLEVAPDNPARALYARLGFEETAGDTGRTGAISVAMTRAPPS